MQQVEGDECGGWQRSEQRGMLELHATPVSSETPAGTHTVTKGLITLTVCLCLCMWLCYVCMCVFLFQFMERQAATQPRRGFNHLPRLKMDILVAPKANVMLQLACHALPTGTHVWASERVLIASERTAEGNIEGIRSYLLCFGSAGLCVLTSESHSALEHTIESFCLWERELSSIKMDKYGSK